MAVARHWPDLNHGKPYVVCTGGEPLLQLDARAIEALHAAGFEIGVETNGTIAAPAGIDWLCVSPKADAELSQRSGNELKLVFPQAEDQMHPSKFEALDFEYFFLQPLDGPNTAENIALSISYCMNSPIWRLSVQVHKFCGIA
jgi:organic radical activating enzyme